MMAGAGRFNKPYPSESRSASTWITETINGSHDFKVIGYSLNMALGVGEFITSDAFPVGGYSWKIRFYPGGDGESDMYNSYVSLYLVLNSNAATDVKAVFEATLFNQSGNQRHKVRKSEPGTFGKEDDQLGWSVFSWRNEMETSGYLKDDCLHFCGRVSVLRSHNGYSIPLPPSNIVQHFGWMLESGEGADVNFEVDGEQISAHKLVLAARSSVFRSHFFGPLNDQNAQCIKIEDMKAPVFKALLHFIYWDELPDLEELTGVESKQASTMISQHLLAAADRYNLDRLILLCAAKLCNDIAVDTVVTTLTLAKRHNCLPLKSVCLKFVALPENLQGVMKTDDFKYLKVSCPNTYLQLLEYAAGINNTTASNNQETEGTLDGSDMV